MACPFTLPRRLARAGCGLGRVWPRPLRTKWLAVGLVASFFGPTRHFPYGTAPAGRPGSQSAILSAAFAVDGLFPAGTFCKYVCPIGQFNFVQSLVSPLEVQVRSPSICVSCTTHECIRGSQAVPGCQSRLFQPHKSSNLDCTFCLDCVHACPHGNVGLLAVVPGRELWRDTFRSGIGRFARRTDLAALVVVLVFGALSNAAGMVGPVLEWEDRVRSRMGGVPPWMMPSLFAVLSLIVVPVVRGRPDGDFKPRLGRNRGKPDRRGDAVFLRARSARVRNVAVPLQFPFSDELGNRVAGKSACLARSRLEIPRRAALPMRLLPPSR